MDERAIPIVVVLLMALIALVVLVYSMIFNTSMNKVHYATSGHTYCGYIIHGQWGGCITQHTTLEENVTCDVCLRVLKKWKKKYEGT